MYYEKEIVKLSLEVTEKEISRPYDGEAEEIILVEHEKITERNQRKQPEH